MLSLYIQVIVQNLSVLTYHHSPVAELCSSFRGMLLGRKSEAAEGNAPSFLKHCAMEKIIITKDGDIQNFS